VNRIATRWSLCAALLVSACRGGGAGPRAPSTTELTARPPAVTGANFAALAAQLDEQAPAPSNRPLRDALARYWATQGLERIADDDYDGAIRALRGALVHYTPDELSRGALPDALEPLARGVLALSNPRGDVARALAANRLLALLQTPDREANGRFEEVRGWGEANRREFRPRWMFHAEMSEIFREVAHIVPERSLVDRSREHAEQRRAEALRELGRLASDGRGPEQMEAIRRSVERPVVDVMLLYLRLGELRLAADRVEAMTGGGGRGLSALLRSLVEDDSAEGYLSLAQQLERLDSAAMAGVCRLGRRRFSTDPRFAQCLSLAASRDGQFGVCATHLERAAGLRAEDPETLGRAIAATVRWLDHESAAENPEAGRAAIARLRVLSAEWSRRFAGQPAPVSDAEIDLAAAQHEVGAANLRDAETLLDRAIAGGQPPRGALVLRAEIAWRKGDIERADGMLARAATIPPNAQESGSEVLPTLTLRRGLYLSEGATSGRARPLLEQAAESLAALSRSLEGERRAEALTRHALAVDALGQRALARQSWDEALAVAPDDRGLASSATVFFLGRGAFSDAARVAAGARGRLQLDRTWRGYFALWQWHGSRLAGDEDERARAALRELTAGAGAISPWTTRLVQRATGELDFDHLYSHASTPGRRAEAHFYEALHRLGDGDVSGARRHLEETVRSDMLHFLEYDAAWSLLRTLDRPGFSLTGRAQASASGTDAGTR
jgi:tetratricopeptide (TPR) repeat protein